MKCFVVLSFLMVVPLILCRTIGKDPDTKDLVEPPLLNQLPKGYFFTYEYAPILRVVNEDLEPEGERFKRETANLTTTTMPETTISTTSDDSDESIPEDTTFKLEARRFLPNTK